PVQDPRVQAQFGVHGDGLKDVLDERGRHLPQHGRAELTTEHGVGPPAYVYDDLRERLVHRHGRLADADDAAPLAERLVERLPQHDGDILDGMVGVNVKVTLCLDDQVEQAVHGDMVQHVVEE